MSVQPSPAQYEAVIVQAAITMLNRVGISGAQAQKMHNPQPDQAAQPDCRTCANYDARGNAMGHQCVMKCVNGNEYLDTAKVVLWRTEP